MKYKFLFESVDGEKSKLKKQSEGVAVLEIGKEDKGIKNAYDFCNLVADKLLKFKEVEVDLESYRKLKIQSVEERSKELILGVIKSYVEFIPWSAKSKPEKEKLKLSFCGGQLTSETLGLVEGIEFAKRLQATPPNILSPEKFVQEVKDRFKDLVSSGKVKIKEIAGEELIKEKLNLIVAVGKASVNPPRLLILEYLGNGSTDKKGEIVGLVGKGICYDSGGLNVKTGPYMSTMKFDMSGGAVSAGLIYAMAKNGVDKKLVVAIPLAENSIAGNAYRPDDVIVSRSGKSIEIDNTDAEGRLVLADAMAYVVDVYKPSELITIATLTGAIGYALGSKYAGGWSTCCETWKDFMKGVDQGFEFVWRMPWDDYYIKALKKSRVADLKNSARTGAGGASRAACFLKEFSGGGKYMHLDIANVAHSNEDDEPRAPLLRSLYFYLSDTSNANNVVSPDENKSGARENGAEKDEL